MSDSYADRSHEIGTEVRFLYYKCTPYEYVLSKWGVNGEVNGECTVLLYIFMTLLV